MVSYHASLLLLSNDKQGHCLLCPGRILSASFLEDLDQNLTDERRARIDTVYVNSRREMNWTNNGQSDDVMVDKYKH